MVKSPKNKNVRSRSKRSETNSNEDSNSSRKISPFKPKTPDYIFKTPEKTPPGKTTGISPHKDESVSDSPSKYSGGNRSPRKKKPIIPPLRPKRKVPMLKGNLFKSKTYTDSLALDQVDEVQHGEQTTDRIRSHRSERPAPLSADRRPEFQEDNPALCGNSTDRSYLKKHGNVTDRSHSRTGSRRTHRDGLLSARTREGKLTAREKDTPAEQNKDIKTSPQSFVEDSKQLTPRPRNSEISNKKIPKIPLFSISEDKNPLAKTTNPRRLNLEKIINSARARSREVSARDPIGTDKN